VLWKLANRLRPCQISNDGLDREGEAPAEPALGRDSCRGSAGVSPSQIRQSQFDASLHTPCIMNIIVEVLALTDNRGAWTAHTLELLGDAKKLAAKLNGLVAAWVLDSSEEGRASDLSADLFRLAAHGCRVVRRLRNQRFGCWSSEAIAAALARHTATECAAIFLPGTSRGEEAAALLAVHLETVWVPDVLTVSVTRHGVFEMTAVEPGGKLSRTYHMLGQRPAVITMRPGVAEARTAVTVKDIAIQNITIDLSDVAELTAVEQFLPADPQTVDIAVAQRIVAGGRGTGGTSGMRLVSSLADALHASLASSQMAVDLGWAPPERQVGQTGKTVRPDLYVACGISGASHHLAGMRNSKHIVAINTDAEAPIHGVAHLSLVDDLSEVVPAIVAAIA